MKKAYICVILTAFLFGTMEVACKLAGSQLDPFQLTFLRFAIGGLILLPFALAELKKNNVKLTAKDFLRLAGVGILGIPVSMVFFQLGIMNSNAATASVLICINPWFTMIFAHFFANEKMNKNKMIVLAVGLVGLIFMIKPWNIQEGNTVIGIIYMLLAGCILRGIHCCRKSKRAENGNNGPDKHKLHTGITYTAYNNTDNGKTGSGRS